MRFRVLDGGGHDQRPRRADHPPGVITEAWLHEREEGMDALAQLGDDDLTIERLEGLVKRNVVCADTFTTLGMLLGDSKKAHELLCRGLLESVLEVFSTFVDAHEGELADFDMALPYLRAIAGLATHHALRGQLDRAVELWQLLLRLDRSDGLCVRGLLYGAHLLTGALSAAEDLWHSLLADPLESLAWGRPLQLWLAGEHDRAAAAVAVARHDHPHVEALLRYSEPRDEWDEDLLGTYLEIAPAWQAQPKALAWLKARPEREATADDYVATGWPRPIPGVEPLMAAHLEGEDLARLTKVAQRILAFGAKHEVPEVIAAALRIANELANVTDFFYDQQLKVIVAATLWVANKQVAGPLDYTALCAELRCVNSHLQDACLAIEYTLSPDDHPGRHPFDDDVDGDEYGGLIDLDSDPFA